MSVPHLDTRFVDGDRSLLFGPYGGFSPKFLKSGSLLDLPLSSCAPQPVPHAGRRPRTKLGLVKYLVTRGAQDPAKARTNCTDFLPQAERSTGS